MAREAGDSARRAWWMRRDVGGSACTWERPGCVSERREARASPEYGPEWLRRRRGDMRCPGASDRGPRSLSQAGL
jgi:hypothetical protein